MLTQRVLTEDQTAIRRHFIDFFESERSEEKYQRRIQDMMSKGSARLIMDLGDLLDYVPQVAVGDADEPSSNQSLGLNIIQVPGKYIPLLELALHDQVLRLQPQYLKVDYRSRAVHVGFDGPVGHIRSPRELYARHLNTMVALEGIVTRQSSNRPRVLETVHYCATTNRFTKKAFRDQLTPMIDSSHLPTVNVMPKTDMEGNPLRTELGLSSFVDSQCAVLQEAPERAPTGQLPRNVELRFDDDLVDCVKPGERVVVVGVYMPYTSADHKTFQSIVLVNHVVSSTLSSAPSGGVSIPGNIVSLEDKMAAFARRVTAADGPAGVMRTLAKAVAPSIYGMANEKAAVLLLMVGGVERKAHHSHIRGDINVLLVGEPSTAKSQLLRFVLSVSPLALSTTGKGSSGVGLTAAVTVDSYSGERSLSAGAMVLADRGILCVDEFDKMSPQDRVAMHEAMEQQSVTIAKAGIHASLNARCSVLAAANPIYGFYSVKHRLAFNVGLPESLLSRFDLTFIVLDQHSSQHNRRIGSYILRNHMLSPAVGCDQAVVKTVVGDESSDPSGGPSSSSLSGEGSLRASDAMFSTTTNSAGERIANVSFLRAYIQLAKQGKPVLTTHSQQLVSEHYVQLRAEQREESSRDGFFITARTLEAIVRLSTAHAKLRWSPVVEEEDVKVAMSLLRASVHAATTALEQREEDRRQATAEASSSGAPPPPPHKRRREEDEQAVAVAEVPPPPSPPSTAALQRRLVDVLRTFQREQRSNVRLADIHQRMMNTTAGAAEQEIETLRSVLTTMQGDSFIFEGVDDGGDDTLQFI